MKIARKCVATQTKDIAQLIANQRRENAR